MIGLCRFLPASLRGALLSAGVLAAAFGTSAWGEPAQAADKPADKQADDGRVRQMDRQMDRYRGQRGGYGDRFDDLNGGDSANDFPLQALQDAVDANTRAVQARAAFNRADWELGTAVRDAMRSFENSAELKSALMDERKAFEDLSTARRAVTEKLAKDPKYQAAVSLRDEFSHKIAESRGRRDVGASEVAPMAFIKLGYATTATGMEALAAADDPRVQEAQLRLMSAGSRVAELHRSFEERMRTDEKMLAARKSLEDARMARVVAGAAAEGAIEIGNEALDYLYLRHRQNYYRYSDYGSGYGYGFGQTYPVRYR